MSSIIIKINNDFRILLLNEINEIDFHFKSLFINNNVNIDNLFKCHGINMSDS